MSIETIKRRTPEYVYRTSDGEMHEDENWANYRQMQLDFIDWVDEQRRKSSVQLVTAEQILEHWNVTPRSYEFAVTEERQK